MMMPLEKRIQSDMHIYIIYYIDMHIRLDPFLKWHHHWPLDQASTFDVMTRLAEFNGRKNNFVRNIDSRLLWLMIASSNS